MKKIILLLLYTNIYSLTGYNENGINYRYNKTGLSQLLNQTFLLTLSESGKNSKRMPMFCMGILEESSIIYPKQCETTMKGKEIRTFDKATAQNYSNLTSSLSSNTKFSVNDQDQHLIDIGKSLFVDKPIKLNSSIPKDKANFVKEQSLEKIFSSSCANPVPNAESSTSENDCQSLLEPSVDQDGKPKFVFFLLLYNQKIFLYDISRVVYNKETNLFSVSADNFPQAGISYLGAPLVACTSNLKFCAFMGLYTSFGNNGVYFTPISIGSKVSVDSHVKQEVKLDYKKTALYTYLNQTFLLTLSQNTKIKRGNNLTNRCMGFLYEKSIVFPKSCLIYSKEEQDIEFNRATAQNFSNLTSVLSKKTTINFEGKDKDSTVTIGDEVFIKKPIPLNSSIPKSDTDFFNQNNLDTYFTSTCNFSPNSDCNKYLTPVTSVNGGGSHPLIFFLLLYNKKPYFEKIDKLNYNIEKKVYIINKKYILPSEYSYLGAVLIACINYTYKACKFMGTYIGNNKIDGTPIFNAINLASQSSTSLEDSNELYFSTESIPFSKESRGSSGSSQGSASLEESGGSSGSSQEPTSLEDSVGSTDSIQESTSLENSVGSSGSNQ